MKPLIQEAGFHSVAVSLLAGRDLRRSCRRHCRRRGRADEVTLVAQSMGAFSTPLSCDRLPVSELVLLNAMIPAPGETAGEWWGNTGQADAMRNNDLREVAIPMQVSMRRPISFMTCRLKSLRC